MEFIYEGNNGYFDYAYPYEPNQEALEVALAELILRYLGKKRTQRNIDLAVGVIRENELTDCEDIMNYFKDDLKDYFYYYARQNCDM